VFDMEENKAIAIRSWQLVSVGDLDGFDEVYAADCVIHEADDDLRGVEALKQFAAVFLEAFPDLQITVEDAVAEGDKVVTRWTGHGTHQGELMGNAPTGNPVTVTGITIHRLEGGKIAEEWEMFDMLGIMQQIGTVPPP
jgi:steroid delta-isomerase-like uncharacterized protein